MRKRPKAKRDRPTLLEKLINQLIDHDYSIQAVWDDFLTPKVKKGDISYGYANEQMRTALNIVFGVNRDYRKIMR